MNIFYLVVKVGQVQAHHWRNENPGERGTAYTAVVVSAPDKAAHLIGQTVTLGSHGYQLEAVDGGWKSVRTAAALPVNGWVAIQMVGRRLRSVPFYSQDEHVAFGNRPGQAFRRNRRQYSHT